MVQDKQNIEQDDAEKVNKAIEAISQHDFFRAQSLLKEVVANTPNEYIYNYEKGGEIFVKFWDEVEFFQYVTEIGDQEKRKRINWIPSAYPRAYFYLAYMDVEEGKYQSALAYLEASIKLEPDQPISLCEMASIASEIGQHKKALSIYEQAIHARKYVTAQVRARALRGKGVELIEIEEFDLAKQCFIESLQYEPNNKVALDEMFYISLLRTGTDATLPVRLLKPAVGVKTCSACGKELLTNNIDEFKVMNSKGKLIFLCATCGEEEPYKDAINAISFEQDYFQAHFALGLVYVQLEKYQRVKYNYAEASYNQGISLVEQGRLDDAVELFKNAISFEQDYFQAHFALGLVYVQLEKYQPALKCFKEAIKINPDFAEAFYYLGDTYIHLEQYQEAIESYKQAIQINPDHAEAHHSLGWAFHLLGRSSEAIESLRKAIGLNPHKSDPFFFLGRVFSDLGNNQESIEAYKEAIRIDRKDSITHYLLAKEYITLLDRESALVQYGILNNLDEAIAKALLEEINKLPF